MVAMKGGVNGASKRMKWESPLRWEVIITCWWIYCQLVYCNE